ncbi:uncharacterized protein [Physeter macrocephalus]|uniref:Uncharacterized protein isoform X2 n=1 Tax=Physeter macrocephalus TaxID=9755 RepID=A0A9W2WTR4_PHYMC|nr:uncharacterized protein LOC114486744 isoform X2 [Physeter catodon]
MELSKGCDPLLPSPTHTPCSLPGHKMAVAVSAITISHQCPGYAASPGERTWESVKKGAFAGVVLKNLSPAGLCWDVRNYTWNERAGEAEAARLGIALGEPLPRGDALRPGISSLPAFKPGPSLSLGRSHMPQSN